MSFCETLFTGIFNFFKLLFLKYYEDRNLCTTEALV